MPNTNMAERIGFEPTVGYPTTTFQAVTLNHSDTSPYKKAFYTNHNFCVSLYYRLRNTTD